MPRSRRRQHSRSNSRSRSRSRSHDRDREPKRRKIESYADRRSVSSEPEANINQKIETIQHSPIKNTESTPQKKVTPGGSKSQKTKTIPPSPKDKTKTPKLLQPKLMDLVVNNAHNANTLLHTPKKKPESLTQTETEPEVDNIQKVETTMHTPNKKMTPKQVQKKLESEKKRKEKQQEREERERKLQEEKEEKRLAKEKLRLEKEDQKRKEKEAKDKEKEMKKMEREKKEQEESQKRKEKEAEKLKKQQEIDEKNKEKQKLEEQKQKAAAAFANFFVAKKTDSAEDTKKEESSCIFIPFTVKTDMRLPPLTRKILADDAKENLTERIKHQNTSALYLDDLKNGKAIGKSGKTWPYDDNVDDCMIINLGESIAEHKPNKTEKMKAKFLKFHENQRPAYFGTWRKKSKFVSPIHPFCKDNDIMNYDVDSDEEWEDEEDGESVGSHEEEKDVESENENDYEVDNEFFVPHNYLSEDEEDDEERMNPQAYKARLKLMKNEFEEEHKKKTTKIKPRLIGCIWYDQKVDDAIDKYLQPLSIICQNTIVVKKRDDPVFMKKEKNAKELENELIPAFLKLLHGNTNNKKFIVAEFFEYLSKNNLQTSVRKMAMLTILKKFARWKKCPDEGPMHKKTCWYVSDTIGKEYNADLKLPNQWEYVTKP